jgi:hypothetical protein
MAERKQSQGDGAFSLSNLKVTTRYLDPQYEIDVHDLTRGGTGLLKVFSLTPKNAQRPSFLARVDDGNPGRRKSPELDIDIEGVTPAIKRHFKANRGGYIGHRTNRSQNPQERIFEVEIALPSGKVFDGDVFFNVHFVMSLETGMYLTQGVEANLVRAAPQNPICSWLKRMWERIRTLF